MSAAVVQPNFFQMLLGYPWQQQQQQQQQQQKQQSAAPEKPRGRQPRCALEAALDRHYNIIHRVGSGSTGVVYQATDRATGALVAVKVIRRSALRTQLDALSVRREIHALKTLQHSHLLRLRRVHADGAYLFLATEYCANGDLHRHMHRTSKPLPECEALAYLRDVLAALAHMHARGFAHRDVKLENVLLAADGSVRLADFGLAYYRHPDDKARSTTRRCGSPHYVAPEIFRDSSYVPAVADVWAAGVMLYALLTRTMPFDEPTPSALIEEIVAASPLSAIRSPLLASLSRPTRKLLRRMLSVNPAERPSAAEASAMCAEILESRRTTAR